MRIAATLLACLIVPTVGTERQNPPLTLNYDLRAGDHLIYRQQLEREAIGGEVEFRTHAEWTNHVIVTSEESGKRFVGFQRKRTRADLVRYNERGKDRLKQQQPDFAEQVARRPIYFAEANRVDPHGLQDFPWNVIREWISEILMDVHEVEPLPPFPVRSGQSWQEGSQLGLVFHFAGHETEPNEDSVRIEGTDAAGSVKMRFWFSLDKRLLTRLEFEGTYPAVIGQYREQLQLELIERRRDETVRDWVGNPDLQQAAMAAMFVSESLRVDPELIQALVDSTDPAVQRRALALLYRYRLPSPPHETVRRLMESQDPRVRTLAVRVLENSGKDAVRPLIERALTDKDKAVRDAGLSWIRARLPSHKAVVLKTVTDNSDIWERLSPVPVHPRDDEDLMNVVQSVQAGTLQRDWDCGKRSPWSERALQLRRVAAPPPGTILWSMGSTEFPGWPYVIHIPEDYRGDEPFPLLMYLSGGAGRAMTGALSARDTISRLGYLVVFPQSNDLWWHDRPTQMVEALLRDVLRSFNVDTNRVYIAGFSNGGTGAFIFGTFWPHRWAAIVSMMGAGIYPTDGEPPLPANVSQLPLLFLHGEEDQRISVVASQDTVRAVRRSAKKAPVDVHILKDRGHDVLLGSDDGLSIGFFDQHLRDPFPQTIQLQVRDLRFPRKYWIEIIGKEKGVAEVQGDIADDNTIRLKTKRVKRLRLLLRRELLPGQGPVRVVLNGKEVYRGAVTEECELLQRSWQAAGDPFLAYSFELPLDVKR